MTRKYLAGLLAAAGFLAAGTFAVVQAQDDAPADAAPAATPEEAPEALFDAPTEEPLAPHEHTDRMVHNTDGSHFLIDDETAYPDQAGFASIEHRASYAIGRLDGGRVGPEVDTQPDYVEGLNRGFTEENEAYAQGYAQGFEMLQSLMQDEDFDKDAFLAGLAEAVNEESQSRAMGYLIGNSYRASEITIKSEPYMSGFSESKATADLEEGEEAPETRLDDEQYQETLRAYGTVLADRMEQRFKEENTTFYDTTAVEEGWTKTESGLLYKVVEAGDGLSPAEIDMVTVHYTGKLADGTVFDSSVERGQPASFPLNGVIAGWTEGVQLMQVGATFEFVIPAELAYGETGAGQSIPGGAVLHFTVELLEITPAPKD